MKSLIATLLILLFCSYVWQEKRVLKTYGGSMAFESVDTIYFQSPVVFEKGVIFNNDVIIHGRLIQKYPYDEVYFDDGVFRFLPEPDVPADTVFIEPH